jgi:hypothetical protein
MNPSCVAENVGHAAECSPRAASTARRIAICDARDREKDEHEKFMGERSDSRGAWICGCRATSITAGIKKSTAIWALRTEMKARTSAVEELWKN